MSGGSSVLWCFPASIPLQGDSVSSVVFYGCVGGAFLLQSLAGGQWFIGSVVCPSVRCGAVHRSGSMGVRWCVSASISCRVIVVHQLGVRVNVGEIWR